MIDTLTTFTNIITAVPTGRTAAITFGRLLTDAKGVTTMVASSPQSDLLGRPVLKRMAMATKAGIVGRTLHLINPYYNSALGKYEGSCQMRLILNAPTLMPLNVCFDTLMYGLNIFAGGTQAGPGFASEFVKADDLPI